MLINIHFFRCKIFLIFVLNAILLSTEPTTVQIQESLGEAVNNIIKHFHKPEKEVWYAHAWLL